MNSLTLALDVRTGAHTLDVTFVSRSSNGGPTVAIADSKLHYDWSEAKNGSLTALHETVDLGKGAAKRHVDGSYDAKANQTKLVSDLGTSRRAAWTRARARRD